MGEFSFPRLVVFCLLLSSYPRLTTSSLKSSFQHSLRSFVSLLYVIFGKLMIFGNSLIIIQPLVVGVLSSLYLLLPTIVDHDEGEDIRVKRRRRHPQKNLA